MNPDPPFPHSHTRPHDRFLALGLYLLALGVRLAGIGQESFFFDEAMTLRACGKGVWDHVLHVEVTPPAYYLLARSWSFVAGDGQVSLRVVSALAGALAAPLVFLTLRVLGLGAAAAVGGGILFALSPAAVWYGQQARAYALLITWVALWVHWVVLAVRNPARAPAWRLALVVFLGFSIHYYFAFVVLAGLSVQLLFFGFRVPRVMWWKRLLGPQLVGGAACLVFVPLVLAQTATGNTRWLPRPTVDQLAEVFGGVFVIGPFNGMPGWAAALAALVAAGSLAGVVSAWIGAGAQNRRVEELSLDTAIAKSPDAPASKTLNPLPGASNHALDPRFVSAFLLALTLLPVVIPFLLSLGPRSIFLKDRYSVVALPPFLLLLVYGLHRLPLPRARWMPALAGVALLLIPAFVGDWRYWTQYQDFDWKGAVRLIEREAAPNDDVLVFIPGWMRHTYETNGGVWTGRVITRNHAAELEIWKAGNSNTAGDTGADKHPANGETKQRIWLFAWEATPSQDERAVKEKLTHSPTAQIQIEFPHIRLWKILSPSPHAVGTIPDGPGNK